MNDTSEWFDVERISDGCYLITEGRPVLPCHTILFHESGDAVLVDAALGIGNLRAVVDDLVNGNVQVILSHSHWDHIGAAHQFDDVAIHGRERGEDGRVTIDVLSEEFGERPSQFVRNYHEQGGNFPDGFDPASYTIEPVYDVDALAPGEVVDVGDRELELVPIPGHSPGQLAVLDRTLGVCHGADILGLNGQMYAHFDDSDLDEYRDSLAYLVELRDEGAFDTFTTGHANPLRGDDLVALEEMQAALDQIVAADAPFAVVDTDYGRARKYSVQGFDVLVEDP